MEQKCNIISIVKTPEHTYKKGELVNLRYNLYGEILVNDIFAEKHEEGL